jgi:class 3 adenylate cyclase/tetratricopeptide (TPR) repeat protein
MTFEEVLDQALAMLQRRGRIAYRTLKRQFNLDDEALEDLKEEIIYSHRLAVDEGNRVLVWTGGAGTTSTPGRDQVPTPLIYPPSHLAEKILTSRSALEGERKQVTVLFADLKGSMELLADRDPEEARAILDPVLVRMMEAVHRYEGTVNQVMGDGIMALFGAPIAHEDHAVRACYAALWMQEAVTRYGDELQRSHGVPVQIRVGLNSGEVVVRAIGSDLHMDYTAVGQTTHLAARMEQMARPGSVLMTVQTCHIAAGYVQVEPLGPIQVKGLTGPVEVFELAGAGPSRTPLQAFAARGLTHFVGREPELEVLRQALARARAGHGQVVALVGEPGMGKSRLCYEFIRSHLTHGWLVLESSAVSYGKATPYRPIIDLLKAYFQIEDRDEVGKIREKVTGKLVGLDTALGPMLSAFLTLLDMPVQDPQWQLLDPLQRRQRTLEALKRLLLRESQIQPILLVFENLHWSDTETQALLDSLVDGLPTAQMLLLVSYRPEYQHGWGSKTYYAQLRLDPLPHASTAEFLQILLGNDPGLQPLKHLLMVRTEGNPFFLEESIRTLVETQVLAGELGDYRVAKELSIMQVPATIQAVLAARIDRLPPEEKDLLQTAAVIGKDIPFPLLQAIIDLPEVPLRHGLIHLQSAEFLYETNLFPDLEYTFKHALTHDVAYGSLLQERRRALHGRIVEALEALYPDRQTEQVERLAHHAFRGEVWDKALAYCRQAGEKALTRSAHREAVGYFEQALNAVRHLPEQGHMLKQAIDLRLALRNALLPFGNSERILAALREAESLASSLEDHARLGQVSLFLSQYFYGRGIYDQALASAQRALTLATAGGEGVLRALAIQYLGRAYQAQGDYHRALDSFQQTMAFFEGPRRCERFGQAHLPAVFCRGLLAWCHAELGTFADGRALGDEGLQIAEAVGHPSSILFASWGVGLLALRQGDLSRALPMLERAVALCQEAEFPSWFPWMAAALGAAYTLAGRLADAVPLLTQAIEQASATPRVIDEAVCGLSLAEAQALAGRLEEARALAERMLTLAQTHQERSNQAYALRLLGEIVAQHDPVEHELAGSYYRQSLALADELGMRPLAAHCYFGRGRLSRKAGWPEQARTELSAAIALYRAMEMTFWLRQAEAVLAEVMVS